MSEPFLKKIRAGNCVMENHGHEPCPLCKREIDLWPGSTQPLAHDIAADLALTATASSQVDHGPIRPGHDTVVRERPAGKK